MADIKAWLIICKFALLLIFRGVTLAQLVKASVGQTDVQRFEPHLGHNCLSCGVPKVQAIWAPSGTNHNGQIGNLYQRVARSLYKSLYLKRRGQLLFQV